MKICHFQKSVDLDASPEVVFAFHENPENLKKISPPSLKVKKIVAARQAIPGGEFNLEATQFGLPIRWLGRWEVVDAPHLLVDSALRGPFAHFRHEHRFARNATGGTRMTDHLEYALPFGILGWIAGVTGARIALELMFLGRHRATKKYFANKASG